MNAHQKWSEPVTLEAFISNYGARPDDLRKMKPETIASALYGRRSAENPPEGWHHVGQMQVSYSLFPAAELTQRTINTLQEQKTKVLAEAQAAATRIDGEIQKLLAITSEAQA